ncbi:RTA1 domain protein, putative [Metarhizium acridum CQMa 102]|uniref:RTA1 domain protein, putative n=1 Tax=Metarhizium acridum (strain CQMa 102) TaxID=655827 RepID=E9EAL4_METAQ|nr:RTA1 domain protein, putative [Metarhizium acridum CQMa 102]EFY87014.1 RTA1 domain protein, putative [Metarhizium acridum CQMa 102]
MEASCGSSCPVPEGFYNYSPNVGGNAVLLAIHALFLPAVLYFGVRLRTRFFSLTLATGHLLSLLGFVGRVLLHQTPDNPGHFLLSLLGTVLGPSFFTASIFVVIPHIRRVYGEHLGQNKPTLAAYTLFGLTTVAIAVEVVGIVFVTYGYNGLSRAKCAAIVVSGLSVQAVALLGSATAYFCLVLQLSSGDRVSDGIEISTTALLAYSIYRIVELAGGVDAGLSQNEIAFMIMDGALPLVSAILLTAFHPGAAFGAAWKQTSPRQPNRPSPLPLDEDEHRKSYNTHYAYDPNIRQHLSPRSYTSQKMAGSPYGQETPSGPSGLPSNPRPTPKPPSPKVPSPRSNVSTNKRFSDRSERRVNLQKDMVDSDALW